MALEVSELVPNAVVRLGASVTVHSGTVLVGGTGGVIIVRTEAPPDDFGFFVPDAAPLSEGETEPQVVAEAYLMRLTLVGTSSRHMQGIDRVAAAYLPDPRGGTARWLHLSGAAHAAAAIRIAYRVTLADRT
jgi:hypothetical protein